MSLPTDGSAGAADGFASGSGNEDTAGGTVSISGGAPEVVSFVRHGSVFGFGRFGPGQDPIWIEFSDIVNIDELGEPGPEGPTVEISTVSGLVLVATFPQTFCDSLVDALVASMSEQTGGPVPVVPESVVPVPVVPVPVVPVPEPRDDAPIEHLAAASPVEAAPLPGDAGVESGLPPSPVLGANPFAATPTEPVVPIEPAFSEPVVPIEPAFSEPVVPIEPAFPEPAFPEPVAQAAGVEPLLGIPVAGEFPGATSESSGTGALPPDASIPMWLQDPADQASASGVVIESESALVIEDVTYIGGHPSAKRKRKKCIGTLTRTSIEITGKGIDIVIPWTDVVSIEAQNPDEARFRISTRIQAESTAIVIQQRDGATVLLEAHSCPKVPLQGAIVQLVGGVGVVVV
jgi:hypothetical protein